MCIDSETELVRKAQAGDNSAFTEIYRRYQKKIYNLVFRMVGNASDAEEVTQEVFYQVLKAVKGFQGKSQFYTWIYRIATNVSLQHRQRVKRARLNPDFNDAILNELSCPKRSVESQLIHEAFLNDVAREIDKLPSDQRRVLVLCGIQRLSYEDVSLMLGISEEVIKGRLHRARENLRAVLSLADLEH